MQFSAETFRFALQWGFVPFVVYLGKWAADRETYVNVLVIRIPPRGRPDAEWGSGAADSGQPPLGIMTVMARMRS